MSGPVYLDRIPYPRVGEAPGGDRPAHHYVRPGTSWSTTATSIMGGGGWSDPGGWAWAPGYGPGDP